MTKGAAARATSPADETDLEEVLRRYQADQAMRGVFKPKTEGAYRVRILPPREKDLFYVPFGMHYGLQYVSTKFGDVRGVACLKRTLDQNCPLCELHAKWKFEAYMPGGKVNVTKKEMAYEIRPSDRFAMNILDLGNLNAGVQIWDVPKGTYELIMNVFVEWGDITKPDTGRAVLANLTKKGDYHIWSSVVPQKEAGLTVDDWRDQRKDLHAYVDARVWEQSRLVDIVGPALRGEDHIAVTPQPIPVKTPPEEDEAEEEIPDEVASTTEGTIEDEKLKLLLAQYQKNNKHKSGR